VKILFACSEYPPTLSGYAKVASKLVEGLRRRQHSVDLLTSGTGCARLGRVAYLDHSGADALKRNHDIVHIFGPTAIFTEQVARRTIRAGRRLVYTVNAFPGMATYFDSAHWRVVDAMYEAVILRPTLARAHTLVFNTDGFAKTQSKAIAHYAVIPNGIDPDHLGRTREGDFMWRASPARAVNRLRLLFVGQLRPYKGVVVLLNALSMLEEPAYTGVTLTVVGRGPDRPRLEALTRRLGLGQRVRFVGALLDEELQGAYANHDVLVLPSVRGESFGIVLLEARAHGLTPMASNLPGVGELARQLGGVAFPPSDPQALASAIRSEAERSGPSETSLDPSTFLWDRVIEDYLAVYANTCASEGR
jgi:glycosyltransferase involved in cell wall biosynthesis